MEDCLWEIDRKPRLHEDGEISESENDDQPKTTGADQLVDSSKLNTNSAAGSNVESNANSMNNPNPTKNSSMVRNQNNNPNGNKPAGGKKPPGKAIKKKQPQQFKKHFDYSNLSETELDEKFRQVYQQIQSLETNNPPFDQQPPMNRQQWPGMQSFQHPQHCGGGPPPPHMNPQMYQPQFNNPQFNNMNRPYPNNPFQFAQPPNKWPIKPNQQPFPAFDQQSINPTDLAKLKKMFYEMKKIIMKNVKSKNNKNVKFGNKKFTIQQGKAGNQQANNTKNDKKRKLIDKNNPNKRMNNGNPANQQQIRGYKQQIINNNMNINLTQPDDNGTFNPVITSDLFPSTNQTTKQRKAKSNGQQVCRYFFSGNCTKGDKCEFIHTKEKSFKVKELCKFYVQGACDKGAKCIFMHKEFPCKFFHTGANCFDSENCKFSHEPLTEEMSLVLKQFLKPKDKKVDPSKKEKALLGLPTAEMRNSRDTWQWQQNIRKLESEKTGEDENYFRISNEFILENDPANIDFTFKKKLYTADEFIDELSKPTDDPKTVDPKAIKKENIEVDTEDDQIKNETPNEPTGESKDHFYHRRDHLISKNNNTQQNSKATSYENKLKKIIGKNKMSKLFQESKKQENALSSNTNLYKSSKPLDGMFDSSDLINKLVQETKVDDLAKQTDAEIDQFANFKSMIKKEHSSTVTSNQIENKPINPLNDLNMSRPKSLIDEIMSSKGFVGSNSLAALTSSPKLIKPLTFTQQTYQFQSIAGLNSAKSFYQSNFNEYGNINVPSESDLFNLNTPTYSNGQFGSAAHDDLRINNLQFNGQSNAMPNSASRRAENRDKDYIISKSEEEDFEFKLYYCDKVQPTYNEYEEFYYCDENARNDVRLIKYFASSRQKGQLSIFEQLNLLANQNEDDKNEATGLTGLSNLRKKKINEQD